MVQWRATRGLLRRSTPATGLKSAPANGSRTVAEGIIWVAGYVHFVCQSAVYPVLKGVFPWAATFPDPFCQRRTHTVGGIVASRARFQPFRFVAQGAGVGSANYCGAMDCRPDEVIDEILQAQEEARLLTAALESKLSGVDLRPFG